MEGNVGVWMSRFAAALMAFDNGEAEAGGQPPVPAFPKAFTELMSA
jgi:hypothetical protein